MEPDDTSAVTSGLTDQGIEVAWQYSIGNCLVMLVDGGSRSLELVEGTLLRQAQDVMPVQSAVGVAMALVKDAERWATLAEGAETIAKARLQEAMQDAK